MKTGRLFLVGLMIVVGFLSSVNVFAQYGRTRQDATVILLKIEGIEGSFKEKGFEKQIQISSWSTGTSADTSENTVAFQDLYLVMNKSRASAALFQVLAEKRVIPSAQLSVVRFPDDTNFPPTVMFRLTLRDVRVTSFQMGGSDGSGSLMDSLSFEYKSGTYEGTGDSIIKDGATPKVDYTVPPKKPKIEKPATTAVYKSGN